MTRSLNPELIDDVLHEYVCFFSHHLGSELLTNDSLGSNDSVLKLLWDHQDAILCCSLKVCILTKLKRLNSGSVFGSVISVWCRNGSELNPCSFRRLMWSGYVAATASVHVCEPSWSRHARDNTCSLTRHNTRKDLRWIRSKGSLLRLRQANATGKETERKKICRKIFSIHCLKTVLPLQGFACLPSGICVSTMGRHVSYEQAVAWKVFAASEDNNNNLHCLAFSFVNWSFVWFDLLEGKD